MKYKKKSAWTAALSLILALLLVGCAATPGVPSVSDDGSATSATDETSLDPASLESITGSSFESGGHLSQFGQEVAAIGTAEPLNDELTLSDDARIMVEKQNGFYIIYVLDGLSVEKKGEGQYEISYTVGTGVATFMSASCSYFPRNPYLPLLSEDRNFESLIDITFLDPRYPVRYRSDEIKLEADDLTNIENEEFRNMLVGSYIESWIQMSSYSGIVETDADVLYVSTLILNIEDSKDERVMDAGSYEIEYGTFENSGVVTIICEFDMPEPVSPFLYRPHTLTLIVDGAEYKSNGASGDGNGDKYVLTYGIELPGDVTLENGYTLIGSGYEFLSSPHVFEIDLSAYAN